MIIGDLIKEFIEHSCLDTLHTLFLDLLSMLEDEIDTLAFYSLSEHYWSIRKKVELLRKIAHIPLEDSIYTDIWLCEDFVPLIEDEDDSFFLFHGFSDDMLILMGDSLECVHHDCNDISTLDRALSSKHTPLFDISRSDLSCPTDPSSIYKTYLFTSMSDDRVDGITSRPWHILHDRAHLSGDSIDERGLSDIRTADDRELQDIWIIELCICLCVESEGAELSRHSITESTKSS